MSRGPSLVSVKLLAAHNTSLVAVQAAPRSRSTAGYKSLPDQYPKHHDDYQVHKLSQMCQFLRILIGSMCVLSICDIVVSAPGATDCEHASCACRSRANKTRIKAVTQLPTSEAKRMS